MTSQGREPPPPHWISESRGGRWDIEGYGQDPDMKFGPGRRYCCFPDCKWQLDMHAVACLPHTVLVGIERTRAVGNLCDMTATVDNQPFEYDVAVEVLVAEMVELYDKRMWG